MRYYRYGEDFTRGFFNENAVKTRFRARRLKTRGGKLLFFEILHVSDILRDNVNQSRSSGYALYNILRPLAARIKIDRR